MDEGHNHSRRYGSNESRNHNRHEHGRSNELNRTRSRSIASRVTHPDSRRGPSTEQGNRWSNDQIPEAMRPALVSSFGTTLQNFNVERGIVGHFGETQAVKADFLRTLESMSAYPLIRLRTECLDHHQVPGSYPSNNPSTQSHAQGGSGSQRDRGSSRLEKYDDDGSQRSDHGSERGANTRPRSQSPGTLPAAPRRPSAESSRSRYTSRATGKNGKIADRWAWKIPDRPPYNEKVYVIPQRRTAFETKDDEAFHCRFDRRNVCGQCSQEGHLLCDCAMPDDDGSIMGCPYCNTKAHFWDSCSRKSRLTKAQRHELEYKRRWRKPPLRSNIPLVQRLVEYGEQMLPVNGCRPIVWSKAFTQKLLILPQAHWPWRQHIYKDGDWTDLPPDSRLEEMTVADILEDEELWQDISQPVRENKRVTYRRTKEIDEKLAQMTRRSRECAALDAFDDDHMSDAAPDTRSAAQKLCAALDAFDDDHMSDAAPDTRSAAQKLCDAFDNFEDDYMSDAAPDTRSAAQKLCDELDRFDEAED